MSGMEDGLFPSYMSISSGSPDDVEEERRLCYVGITRAKKHLMMTAARARMIRGETQYNPVSRFIKELPKEVMDGYYKPSKTEDMPVNDTFKKAKASWKNNSFAESVNTYKSMADIKTGKDMGNVAAGLDYAAGDRVSHIKFGEGTVLEIKDGGRDYEVTVDFDEAGVRKMFASFAKLKKC